MPNGHQSEDPEWCDTCGARLGRAPAPATRPACPRIVRCAGPRPRRRSASRRRPIDLPALLDAERGRGAVLRGLRLRLHDRPGAADDGADRRRAETPEPPAAPAAQGWVVVIEVDPAWYELKGQLADHPCPPPTSSTIALSASTALIGRTSQSRQLHPEIALDGDTGVSRRHAQLVSPRTDRGRSSTSARRTARTSCRPASTRATTSKRFRSASLTRSPTATPSTSEPGRSSPCAAPAAESPVATRHIWARTFSRSLLGVHVLESENLRAQIRLARRFVPGVSTATRATVRPRRSRIRPTPTVSKTLSATLRANHGSWASCRAAFAIRRGCQRSARYSTSERVPPDVAEPPSGHELPPDGQRDADRRERVVDQQRPAVADSPAPIPQVGPGRPVAVGTVDVQHVDRTGDRVVRRGGERGHVADAVGDAGAGQVGLERTLGRRTPRRRSRGSSCGPRSLPACGSMATTSTPVGAAAASTIVERPRKLPISTIRPPRRQRAAAANSRLPCSSVIHPSTPPSASVHSSGRSSRYTPSP